MSAITPIVPATLLTTPDGDVTGIILDGTRVPLSVLRRALRDQATLHEVALALGFEDTRDPDAVLARVRVLHGQAT